MSAALKNPTIVMGLMAYGRHFALKGIGDVNVHVPR